MSELTPKEVAPLVDKANFLTFDSERGAKVSDLCRKGKDGRLQCVKVKMTSAELSVFMSNCGFICTAAPNPTDTFLECRRIAEKPLDDL